MLYRLFVEVGRTSSQNATVAKAMVRREECITKERALHLQDFAVDHLHPLYRCPPKERHNEEHHGCRNLVGAVELVGNVKLFGLQRFVKTSFL